MIARCVLFALLAGLLAWSCGPTSPASKQTVPQSVDPEAAEAALAEARALLGNDKRADPPKALARLESTFGPAPSEPEAAFLLARAAFRAEQPEKCSAALDAYFAHEPKGRVDWSAEAWVLRGWLLERSGKPAEAIPAYDRALQVSPDYPFALLRKGAALADGGDVKGGIEQVERAIARRPGLLEAHFTLSHLYRRAGRNDDADREARIHRLLNQTTDNTANTPESVMEKLAAYQELERLLPQWVEGRLTLVQMEWKGGLREPALAGIRKLVADHPESAEAKALYEQLGQLQRASGGH